MAVVDKTGPYKTKRGKENTQKWFDGKFWGKLSSRDKIFQKLKSLDSTLIKSYLTKRNMNPWNWLQQKSRVFLKAKNLRKYW